MRLQCPRCGATLETGAAAPGSAIACTCGNVVRVPARRSRALWIVLAAIGALGCVPCTGVVAAIAIPNFIRFQARAKEAECKANLRAFAAAQRAHFDETEEYALDLAELGFFPERGNRYAYFSRFGAPIQDRSGPRPDLDGPFYGIGVDTQHFPGAEITSADAAKAAPVEVIPGISGECPECAAVMVCAGNLDGDGTLDVWSVSTAERQLADGTAIPAGEPFHHVEDWN